MPTRLLLGDCLRELKRLPDASVDAVVTDPPYGLSNTDPAHVSEAIVKWATGERDFIPEGKGFMGKAWDAFVPPPAVWDEAMRVLKPGGHLLAFAGSRTFDLMTLSIRLAGFDIRDSIAWLYGSGFPKSLDVSKAIDKAGGVSPAAQAGVLRSARERAGMSREQVAAAIGCTASSVRDWEEGRARKTGNPIEFITPSDEYRGALAELLGYTADERRIVGTEKVQRRGDGSVFGLGHMGHEYGAAATDEAEKWEGWGTALKPAFEPVVVARKPLVGTVAANVLAHGTGALNIDASRIHGPGSEAKAYIVKRTAPGATQDATGRTKFDDGTLYEGETKPGRWPANVILDESQAAALDEQTGALKSGGGDRRGAKEAGIYGAFAAGEMPRVVEASEGGASRFFYVAKAPKVERPVVDGIAHPTVKPLALMRYLVRLVTPPGGVVLDPFLGSGTTLEAALLGGFDCWGIEREESYLPLILARAERQGLTLQEL